MAKYFTSLLLKGAEAFRQELADQAKQHSITVVNITAKVASVGENVLGECCSSYWVSKAAVATKNLSSELRQGKSNVVIGAFRNTFVIYSTAPSYTRL